MIAVLVACLLALAASHPALAAPVIAGPEPAPAADLCPLAFCAETPGLILAEPVVVPDAPYTAIGTIWRAAAAVSLEPSAAIAPVPLPAAGWLVLAGLGALGLMRRRRDAALPSLRRRPAGTAPNLDVPGLEPLASALRGTAIADTDRVLGARPRARRADPALHRLRVLGLRAPWIAHEFPPGTASPAVPCGGSAHSYSPLAERAPPAASGAAARRPSGAADCEYPVLSSMRHATAPLGRVVFFCAGASAWRRPAPCAAPVMGRVNYQERVEPAFSAGVAGFLP